MITSFEDDLLTNYILNKVMSLIDNFKLQTFIKEPDQTWSGEKKINVSEVFGSSLSWMTHFEALGSHLMWWVKYHHTRQVLPMTMSFIFLLLWKFSF